MKKAGILFMTIIWLASIANAQSMDNLRLAYHDATESEENAEAFYEYVKDVNKDSDAVLLAYKGAGETLLARYMRLTERSGHINDAVKWIEEAVQKSPQNAEIRLIRLSVQEHLPRFLGYHKNIDEDREFVENALPAIKDEGLKKMINGYFDKFAKK